MLLAASLATAEDRSDWRYTVTVRGWGTLYMDNNLTEYSTALSLARKTCSKSGAVKYVWKDGSRVKLVAVFFDDKCRRLYLVKRSGRIVDLKPRVTGVSYR